MGGGSGCLPKDIDNTHALTHKHLIAEIYCGLIMNLRTPGQ